MRRKAIAAVWALTALVSLRDPAIAQSTEAGDVTLEVSIGLDGWVELSKPVRLSVTIRSELLFVGRLELRHGRAVVTTPVEVPAGGEKTYELLISATIATQALSVQLVASVDDLPVATLRVEPKDPTGQLLVGSLGFPGDLDLPRETTIGSVPIVEVRLQESDTDLEALDYLALASAIQVSEAIKAWVADGGRLFVPPGSAFDIGDTTVADQVRSGVYRLGAGRVIEQERSTLSSAEWASLLVPFRAESDLTDFWGSSEVQMIRAASNSAKAGIPYAGALVGLVVYAIVVAPVNLIVLRRMRRRELAWITVPAISLVAVMAFVITGSIQNHGTDWGQATVIGGHEGGSEVVSVVAASASGPQSHTLATTKPAVIYAAATTDAAGAGGRAAIRNVVSEQQIELIFGDAGYGTVAVTGPTPPLPAVQLIEGNDGSSIQVENLSPFKFEAFGAVTGVAVAVGPGDLAPGEEALFAANEGACPVCSIAEAVVSQTGLWNDSRWWQIYEPLASAARDWGGDQYFFGFVENLPLTIQVDGVNRAIDGPGLVVVQMDRADLGRASPRIVATSPEATVQGEGPWRWFSGDWALMEFTVPIGREISLHHEAEMFGPVPSVYEAWDWTTGSFERVDEGEIDQQRFVGADGVILVRVNLAGADETFFGEFPIGSVFIIWDSGPG